jgi:predicted Rossmann fold nucleotide-binding protein DprA/Smf involved in DNA uptake
MSESEKEILESIDRRLESMLKLLASEQLSEEPTREQVKRLHQMGFEPEEIGDVIGETQNNVTSHLYNLREDDEISGE